MGGSGCPKPCQNLFCRTLACKLICGVVTLELVADVVEKGSWFFMAGYVPVVLAPNNVMGDCMPPLGAVLVDVLVVFGGEKPGRQLLLGDLLTNLRRRDKLESDLRSKEGQNIAVTPWENEMDVALVEPSGPVDCVACVGCQ